MEIVILCLMAYIMATPFFYAQAIKFGMKIMSEPEKAPFEKVFSVPVPKKKPKMTPEQDRTAQILANIDRYDGTSQGQKKVEVKHG